MVSWDDVDVVAGGDETVNFGPRFESGATLYQLETHATISARGKAAELPRVLAHANTEAVFVGVDRQLSVFTDNCRKYLATLEFASDVCALDTSEDGKFLAVGERSGAIHLFDRADCLKLFSFVVEEPVAGDSRPAILDILLKCEKEMSEKSQLMVLTGFNRIHVFGLDLKNLESKTAEGQELMKSLKNQMSHMTIDTSQVHDFYVNSMLLLPSSISIITVGSGQSGKLCLWKKKDERFCPFRTAVHIWNDPIVKCAATICETYLILLDQGQNLTLWSIDDLVVIFASKVPCVQDFSIINSETKDQAMCHSVLTLSREPTGGFLAKISTIPAMQCLYSVQLDCHVTLARCSSLLEEFYVIEGESDAENAERISKLRVRSLTEALPESRLQRMLQRNSFVEAEEFARQFELDVQSVYKAKARFLLDALSQSSVNSPEEDSCLVRGEALKACFAAIDDDDYVVRCVLSAAFPSLEFMLDVLEHVKTRLKNRKTSNRDVIRLMKKITETTHRLGTFQMAYGGGCFSGAKWKRFQEVDLADEIARCLQDGRIGAVWIIWMRHCGHLQSRMTCDRVAGFLNLIPDDASEEELIAWLSKALIPFAVRNLPDALPLIALWIEDRVKNMEILKSAQWPRNALVLCELLSSTFKNLSMLLNKEGLLTPEVYATQVCNLSVSNVKTKSDDDQSSANPFVRLLKLSGDLSALCELQEKFNCRLKLSDFQMETVESVAYRLLDRVVAVELIPDAIRNTLRLYLKQHSLNEDKILYQYVGNLSQRYGRVVSCVGPAAWEVRAIEVIRCIKDLDFRCEALLGMMGSAYIPWSSELETVVEETLRFDECPKKKEIQEKCRMVEFRKLLISYGLRNFSITDRDCAEMLVYHVLRQDRPLAVQDALHVVAFYSHLNGASVYLFRAKFLVECGREAQMVELVKSLPSSEAAELCTRFVRYAQIVLSSAVPKSLKILYSMAACVVIRLLLKLNSEDEWLQEDYSRLYSAFEGICSLQVEFDEFLSIEEYESTRFRKELFMRCLRNGFAKSKENVSDDEKADQDVFLQAAERKPGKSNSRKCRSIYRLARLLNIQREELSFELASKAVAKGKPTDAIAVCRELVETVDGSEAGLVLVKVVHLLCDYFKNATDCGGEMLAKVASEIHELAQLALLSVPGDVLVDCLRLCRSTHLAFAAWNQCESGAYMSTVDHLATPSGGPRELSSLDDLFVEDGLVLDSTKILPHLFTVASDCCLPCVNQCGAKFSHSRLLCTFQPPLTTLASLFGTLSDVINYLRDSAQVELACRVAMESVTLTMEYMASHPTCLSNSDEAKLLLPNLGKLVSAIREMTIGALHKIFVCQRPDLCLAFAYVCSLPKQVAYDCLGGLTKSAGLQYKRVGFIAQVGLAYSEFAALTDAQKACRQLADNARWGYNLAKMKISFSKAFQGGKTERLQLLPVLARNKLITIGDLEDYCLTFELERDAVFLDCIKWLVIPNCPNSEVSLVSSVMPVDAAIARAKALCGRVEKIDDLVRVLGQLFAELEPCDYERIEFVLQSLEALRPSPETSRDVQVLDCLKQYSSSASSGRLPFHPLVSGSHWSVVTPELNAETVENWLFVGGILKLQKDSILATAIRNILEKYTKERQSIEGSEVLVSPWKENSHNLKLFDTISGLLAKISDFELVIATAVWIIKMLPAGADKVLALKCCVTMVQKWYASCPEVSPDREKAHKTLTEHTTIYRRLQTEQILHNENLNEPELIALSGLPAKLIFKLYEHPSITKERDLGNRRGSETIDMHSVVRKIAAANRVDVDKIRLILIKEWLPSLAKQMQESADVTMAIDELPGLKDDDDQDELNLLRVIYLMQCQPVEKSVPFLLDFAFSADATKVTYQCRVRALRCLFALADNGPIEQIASRTVAQICRDMKTFLYLAELEQLRMPHTPESFEKISKEGLARTIWRNHNHDPKAVLAASDLCLDFSIADEQLWNCIAQQLISFQNFGRLFGLLDRLSAVPDVWHLPFIEGVVNSLVSHVLGNASLPLADQKLSECLSLYSIICRLPSAMTIVALEKLMDEYRRLKMDACEIGLALMLPPSDKSRNRLNELASQSDSKAAILRQLEAWTGAGHAVPLAGLILDFVNGKLVSRDAGATSLLDESRYRNGGTDELQEDFATTISE